MPKNISFLAGRRSLIFQSGGAMKSGQQDYYLALAREDYYLNGGEPLGVWHGQGAADLGLIGAVDGTALTRMFEGFHPTEGRAVVQNARAEDRPAFPMAGSSKRSRLSCQAAAAKA